MANANGNNEYKSDVFSMLLQEKWRALEVYNAINGTAYDDPEQVELTTLENRSFSLTVRNDASFILDADLSLYEHQSTYCPNMPLRDLFYFASIIQKRIHAQKRDLYGKTLVKIPVPHFVVFYNGKDHAPEHYTLRLSDAFERETDAPEIELVCHVYNINKGYAVFKQIDILYQNEEYSILKKGTDYGISLYDHIALEGDSIEENDLVH